VDVAPDSVHPFQTMDKARVELRVDTVGNLFNQESAQEIGRKL
jgi:hypothetical protein